MILRETQNQNDADDANDVESGIWYRDILKTASRASSASLSSHKSSAGVWGYTPEMRLWISKRYASKTRLPPKNDSTQPRCPYKFVYPQSESTVIHPKILTRKSESVLIHAYNGSTISATVINGYLVSNWERKHILQWSILWFYILGKYRGTLSRTVCFPIFLWFCPHRCYSKANMVRAFDSWLWMLLEFVYRGGSIANTGNSPQEAENAP